MKISLPSAADLFDSVEASSASFMSAPVASADTPLTTPKRKHKDSGGGSGSGSKKSKGPLAGEKAAAGKGDGGPSRGLIPPQMSRPNIVTEDSALWSSDSAIKRQRQVEAEKKGRARKEKGAEKGGKDSLSFKQREKVRIGLCVCVAWGTILPPSTARTVKFNVCLCRSTRNLCITCPVHPRVSTWETTTVFCLV